MKKGYTRCCLCVFAILLMFITGCGKEDAATICIKVTTPIEVDAQSLQNVSVELPEGMTRETVSDIQHDFIRNGKQVGGIVIVDISDEMLDSPYENLIRISDLLGQQLMPDTASEEIAFIGAGGNDYAYMEIYTGKGEDIQYYHYLFRGQVNTYDVWFANDFLDSETRNEILAAVSSQDITEERNKSVF